MMDAGHQILRGRRTVPVEGIRRNYSPVDRARAPSDISTGAFRDFEEEDE